MINIVSTDVHYVTPIGISTLLKATKSSRIEARLDLYFPTDAHISMHTIRK